MTEIPQVRLVIVDDHPTFRIGMAALLSEIEGFEVIGEAASQEEAVRVVVESRPDVVIMDLDLGGGSGVDATRDILRGAPGTGILVVTMSGDDHAVFTAMRAGARGYLLKGAEPADIERSIRAVAAGGVTLGPEVADVAVSYLTGARTATGGPFQELTEREREVLELVARGHDNTAIAQALVLTPKTVRNYVYAVFTKLDVNDRAALVVKAREAGIGLTNRP
ncbi:response regulator transcription factor [Nocardioides sp. SR21]|uniref:response regulator n=1 Tax=Nocardioides sp. SR21 TaxID=2919501 RepID=UPI001FAA2550|nr:response regulator transcription factor [Nocardioides sp. SR21]